MLKLPPGLFSVAVRFPPRESWEPGDSGCLRGCAACVALLGLRTSQSTPLSNSPVNFTVEALKNGVERSSAGICVISPGFRPRGVKI